MTPKEKAQKISQIMYQFERNLHALKKEYRKKIQVIIKKAEQERLEKLRKDLHT